MNRLGRNFAAALVAALLLAPVLAASAEPTTIAIVASNWKFTPSSIDLHAGVPTTLKLSSSEGVHGLESPDLGVAKTMLMPGSTTSVVVTPKKTGTYVLHCAVMCGAGHADMALTVHVLP